MKPIYQPTGRAGEYGDYAINIYTGCPHGCYYCYADKMAQRWGRDFTHVEPRKDILDAVMRQIDREHITDKLIHLCFSCDPYPTGYDTITTRQIIWALKKSGNHVQILTKGDGSRDFDLLDGGDWYGITLSGALPSQEPGARAEADRLRSLEKAHELGIKTWVSFEPVINDRAVLFAIETYHKYFDKVKIGKLNYHPSDIDWGKFGRAAEALCQKLGLDYYIKEDLQKEMEK